MILTIYRGCSMKIDMSREAVTNRLKTVEQLRKLCLSLAKSSAGQQVRIQFSHNESIQRIEQILGANQKPCDSK